MSDDFADVFLGIGYFEGTFLFVKVKESSKPHQAQQLCVAYAMQKLLCKEELE